jgi:hypothetical protein
VLRSTRLRVSSNVTAPCRPKLYRGSFIDASYELNQFGIPIDLVDRVIMNRLIADGYAESVDNALAAARHSTEIAQQIVNGNCGTLF